MSSFIEFLPVFCVCLFFVSFLFLFRFFCFVFVFVPVKRTYSPYSLGIVLIFLSVFFGIFFSQALVPNKDPKDIRLKAWE